MTKYDDTNFRCPFCKREMVFYEFKKLKTKIKFRCGACGCERDKALESSDIQKTDNNYFHIFAPFYSAWQEYGWQKNDWGIGLNKERVDALAAKGIIIWLSFGKDEQTKYSINSTLVQTFPVRPVQGKNVDLYVVPRSKLSKLQSNEN